MSNINTKAFPTEDEFHEWYTREEKHGGVNTYVIYHYFVQFGISPQLVFPEVGETYEAINNEGKRITDTLTGFILGSEFVEAIHPSSRARLQELKTKWRSDGGVTVAEAQEMLELFMNLED